MKRLVCCRTAPGLTAPVKGTAALALSLAAMFAAGECRLVVLLVLLLLSVREVVGNANVRDVLERSSKTVYSFTTDAQHILIPVSHYCMQDNTFTMAHWPEPYLEQILRVPFIL